MGKKILAFVWLGLFLFCFENLASACKRSLENLYCPGDLIYISYKYGVYQEAQVVRSYPDWGVALVKKPFKDPETFPLKSKKLFLRAGCLHSHCIGDRVYPFDAEARS